jgi:hypothetical protein
VKLRLGFVSNSSTSSFFIGTNEDFPDGVEDIVCKIIAEHPRQAAKALISVLTAYSCGDEGGVMTHKDEERIGEIKEEFPELKPYRHLYELSTPQDNHDIAAVILTLTNGNNIKIVDTE